MMLFSRILRIKNSFRTEIPVSAYRSSHELVKVKDQPCQYPPIFDASEEALPKHYRKIWYDSIKALPTVEQKLHEIATQQLLDLKTFTLTTVPSVYNACDFYTYITRTHLISGLPKQITDIQVGKELDEIKESLRTILYNHCFKFWRADKKNFVHDLSSESSRSSDLVKSLIIQCYKKLGVRNDYIRNSTIQQQPRICSFWWHGGYGKNDDEEHIKNLCFQFVDSASFALRIKQPLMPILPLNHELCSNAEVLNYHYHPDVFQTPTSTHHLTSIPGFWPGDPCEFPFLLVNNSGWIKQLTSKIEKYNADKIEDSVGVMSSFAWLNALSTYQGFTPFHDVTYPFVTQAILTNGQDWRFLVYQLNTVAFHNDVDHKNRRNICWSSGNMRLFETIEGSELKGINYEVFKTLLQFLHNAPQSVENIDLKPYLGEDNRSEEERGHLRYLLRKMYRRVPEHMAHRDEIPAWVQIYKLHPDAPPSPFVKLV